MLEPSSIPRMTNRDAALLRDLWLFRYLTTKQISRLHFGHLKIAQRRLRALTARKLVDRFRTVEASQTGFRTWWYRLARRGAEVVCRREDLQVERILPPTRRPRTMGFLAHHGLLSDFRIWLREGCHDSAGEFGYRFIPSYEEVRGGRGRRVALSVPRHRRLLIPDGVFELERRDRRRALFLLEIDRGTEPLTGKHRSSIVGKFGMYRDAFESRAENRYAQLFDADFSGFRVLCIVPDETRQAGFLRLAAKMDLVPIVWVTTQDVLESRGDLDLACWSTTVDGELHALTE